MFIVRKVNMLSLFIFAVGCSSISNAQTILNGSLEKWGDDHVCEINLTPNDWTNYSTGCLALDEANFLICPTTIPPNASHGNIYARACAGPDWQGGEGLFQDVSGFVAGQSYTLHFDYAGSNLYGGSDSVKWRIYIDDTLVDQTPYFSSAKNTWSAHAFNFEATQTTHKIGIRAYFIFPSTTGDGSAAIDNISLSAGQAGLDEDLKANGIQIFPTLFQDQITV